VHIQYYTQLRRKPDYICSATNKDADKTTGKAREGFEGQKPQMYLQNVRKTIEKVWHNTWRHTICTKDNEFYIQ